MAVRCYILTDDYIRDLLVRCDLRLLEKLLVLVPGLNNMPNIIPLTPNVAYFALEFCPKLKRLGNLLSWQITAEEYEVLKRELESQNYDIDLMYRRMVIH
ncbi:MAG TPA: hypothetical protein EYQ00_04060 [Dehalococcoidia bacterium]|nr:hypothetical protein [Dehalococcoidia bacterium]